MSIFSFSQTKTSGTDLMTVRKDDKSYVLVEAAASPETKEVSSDRKNPFQGFAAAAAVAKSAGLKIARLPAIVANIEQTHTFRYGWLLSNTATGIDFHSNHIGSPLAYATTTTAARCLMVSGRLRKISMFWADSNTTGAAPSALAPFELSWYPSPGTNLFTKRTTLVPSLSTNAGGGMLTVTPPKNSWQSMWMNPTAATPIPMFSLECDVSASGTVRYLVVDITIDCQLVAGTTAINAVPSLTVSTGIADKVVQLVPLANGSTAGDAQGYYTASY